MDLDESKTLNEAEATLAVGLTNAFFTNLLRKQYQGLDTSNQEIREKCMKEVFDFYVYAQKNVKKNQK